MIRNLCSLLLIIFGSCITIAQEIKFNEKVNEKFTRFFYDENYFLVDKNCEFKAIERVAEYDSLTLNFNGKFKDFNRNGKLILEGAYNKGSKEGEFIAYHPNGQIKWKSTFANNKEVGFWKYYYPDGKPMLVLSLDSNDFKFVDFWDSFGNQKVISGEGVYDMDIKIKGFTDHGYTAYKIKGTISKGKPDGNWRTSFLTEEKKKTPINLFSETFSKGVRTSFAMSYSFSELYIPQEDFPLVPSDYFGRAELFLVQSCSFDEFSGFQTFIARKFNSSLSELAFKVPNTNFQYKVKYTVNNSGIPTKIEKIEGPEDLNRSVNNRIMGHFDSIMYFIPSVLDGKPIKDNITLIAYFTISNEACTLQYLKIERENGQ